MESEINVKLIEEIRYYIKLKTGKLYFKHIRQTPDNIIVTCPFHKDGQERKPSATIRVTTSEKTIPGMFKCFTCGEAMPLDRVLQHILGDLYNEDEIESKFGLQTMAVHNTLQKEQNLVLFHIPKENYVEESVLQNFRYYHDYLKSRNITEEVARIYDIGFDKFNNHITFPLRDIYKNCVGIGRRDISRKVYRYPTGLTKPLYGVYELDKFIRYLYVVEGPFNLWSLKGWGKQGVALLGTGTESQYKELLNIECKGYVLALDPDDAGRNGTYKLGKYLMQHKKYNIYVALLPDGKDVNDLNEDEFRNTEIVSFNEWIRIYKMEE